MVLGDFNVSFLEVGAEAGIWRMWGTGWGTKGFNWTSERQSGSGFEVLWLRDYAIFGAGWNCFAPVHNLGVLDCSNSRWQPWPGGFWHSFVLCTSCTLPASQSLMPWSALKVAYCNVHHMKLPLKSIHKLQLVQHAALWAVTCVPRMALVTGLLHKLHWFCLLLGTIQSAAGDH